MLEIALLIKVEKNVRELKKQNKWEKTYYKTVESVKATSSPFCILVPSSDWATQLKQI